MHNDDPLLTNADRIEMAFAAIMAHDDGAEDDFPYRLLLRSVYTALQFRQRRENNRHDYRFGEGVDRSDKDRYLQYVESKGEIMRNETLLHEFKAFIESIEDDGTIEVNTSPDVTRTI